MCQGRVFYTGEAQITRILNPDLNPDLIRVIRVRFLWFLAFALSRITALLFRLLLFLRLRWTLVFWLLRLRLRLWSGWRCDTLASWLLLSYRARWSFCLRRTGATLSLLLLTA